MRSRPTILILLAMLAVSVSPLAGAQNLVEKRPRSERSAERARVSLDQAVNMAESRYRAKAVKTQQSVNGDRVVYHIRLLSGDGRVWTVQVDAQTGQMY